MRRRFWVLAFVFATLVLAVACSGPVEALRAYRTYFISNTGADGNDGLSPATAWRSLARLRTQVLEPGDHIALERGSVFRETLTVTASGTEGRPIVYESYGSGARPVISGADVVTNWVDAGSGIYRAPLAVAPQRLWVDHTAASQAASPGSLGDNQFAYAMGWLYLRLPGGLSPADHVVEASQRPAAISDIDGHSFITLEDLVAERANGSTKTDAVINATDSSSNWTVENCVAKDGAANGFFGEGGPHTGIGSFLLVIHSEASGNLRRGAVAAGSDNIRQSFDQFDSHDNLQDGILINSSDGQLINSSLNRNGSNKGFHAFYIYPWGNGGDNWDIVGNQMYDNADSGGRIAGRNQHVANNVISGSHNGLFVVDNDGPNDGHVIENNTIMDTASGGYAFDVEGALNVVIRDNRILNSPGIGVVQGTWRANVGLRILNNRFGGNPSYAFIYIGPSQAAGTILVGNCYDPAIAAASVGSTTSLLPTASGLAFSEGVQDPVPVRQLDVGQAIRLPVCTQSGT